MLLGLSLPTLLTIAATIFFLSLERIAPGRRLPPVRGWYARAILMNLVQLLLTLGLSVEHAGARRSDVMADRDLFLLLGAPGLN